MYSSCWHGSSILCHASVEWLFRGYYVEVLTALHNTHYAAQLVFGSFVPEMNQVLSEDVMFEENSPEFL